MSTPSPPPGWPSGGSPRSSPTVRYHQEAASVQERSPLFAIVIYLLLVVVLYTLTNWLQRTLVKQQTKMRQARATADTARRASPDLTELVRDSPA